MATQIGLNQAQEKIGNVDGSPWIRNEIELYGLVDALGLDYYHLREYVQKTRLAVHGQNDPAGQTWRDEIMGLFYEQGYDAVWERLIPWRGSLRGAKRSAADQLIGYIAERREMIRYVGSGGGGGGGHAILPRIPIDLHYLCGLLNSACLDAFLQRVTTPFHSGWFAYSKAYIAQIPIKLPETAAEKKLADRIVESVREIVGAKTKLRDGKLSDRERGSLESDVEAHERRIDEAVFRLYGVDRIPD